MQLKLLSNGAVEEERNRLLTQNCAVECRICGNCGTNSLEMSDVSAHGKPPRKVGHKKGFVSRARPIPVIHKPFKGLLGACFTISCDHQRQRTPDENIQTLSMTAHDDIVVGVNLQTKMDRKITRLNCPVRANIESRHVIRGEVNFDPTVDPLEAVEDAIFAVAQGETLHKQYQNTEGTCTTPLVHFQRLTGRFDEPAPSAAAQKQRRHFVRRAA